MTVFADRVKETFTTTGTGTISLGGAAVGFQTFFAGCGSPAIVTYCMDDGVNWEVGFGTMTHGTPDTLTRNLYSSSSGSLINWGAGTKNVYLVLSAHDIVRMGNNTPINNQSTSYSLVVADAGYLVRMNSSSALNLTIPLNATQAFNVGDTIAIEQVGTGSVTLVPTGGVTLNIPPSTNLVLAGQNARVILTKEALPDTWSASAGLTNITPVSQLCVINSGTGDLPINYKSGTVVRAAFTHAITTITFTNWPASGTQGNVELQLTADGTARTSTWSINGVTGKWPGGSAPTISSTNTYQDIFRISSDDNLATIKLYIVGQAIH